MGAGRGLSEESNAIESCGSLPETVAEATFVRQLAACPAFVRRLALAKAVAVEDLGRAGHWREARFAPLKWRTAVGLRDVAAS